MKTYLIVCEATGLVKIGKGANPTSRLSVLQVGSTSKLSLAHVFDCDIEQALHDKFFDNREMGEWFSVSVDDVVDFVKSSEIDDLKAKPTAKQLRHTEIAKNTKPLAVDFTINKKTIFETRGASIKEKYPFSKLEIGQGFKMPSDVSIQSFRCLAYQRGKSLGRKFSVSVSGYVERIS